MRTRRDTDEGPAPTDAQIRHAIDSGKTGEKIEWPDPAAAPMGTDAEAAGDATSSEALRREEVDMAGAPQSRQQQSLPAFVVYLAIVALIAGIVVIIAFYA